MFSERVQCKCKVYYPCTVKVYCILHITRVCTVYVYSLFFTHVQSTYTVYCTKWLSLVTFDRQLYQWWLQINVTMSHVANHMLRVRGHRRTITCRISEVIGGQSIDNESRKMSIRFSRTVWVSHAVELRMKGVSKGALSVSWLWSSVELSV